MKPVPELDDRELAALVHARLEARQPRHLPERFVPPAPRAHRRRWALLGVAAAILLGLAATAAVRPDLGSAVVAGLVQRLPGAHTGTPRPSVPAPPSGAGRTAPASRSPGPAGSGGGAAPSPGSTAAPPGGGLPVPLPSLPPVPLPVPTPSVPPLPLPTPSLPPLR